ncbi:MAG: hypothetical protein MUC50_08115 [Myxococcota bacterium]|nr:hypothetical protein [Myxococcota bacterium]
MTTKAAFLMLLTFVFCGCQASDTLRGGDGFDDSGGGSETGNGSHDSSDDAALDTDDNALDDGCSQEAKYIYVVTTDKALLKFDPGSKMFFEIGEIDCPEYNSPVSMAVSRDAVAYVLYDGGKLFRVSTSDASCQGQMADLWTGNQETRGMGFATVGNSTVEVLYTYRMNPAPPQLATIDTHTWKTTPIGPMTGRPELTGTGKGELWGFFASAPSGPIVARVDTETGALATTFDASAVGGPESWAFAFWGGAFYIFSKEYNEPSTTVYEVKATGQLSVYMANTGVNIVGAGVSTCAPVTPI